MEMIVGLLNLAVSIGILVKIFKKPTPLGSPELPKTVEEPIAPQEEKPPQVWLNCHCCGKASFNCIRKGKFLVCENCLI